MMLYDIQELSIDNHSNSSNETNNNNNNNNNNNQEITNSSNNENTITSSNNKMIIQSSSSDHERQRHNMVRDVIERLKKNDPYYLDLSIRHIPNEYITYYDIEDIMNVLKTNTIVRTVEIWLPKIPIQQQVEGIITHNYDYYQCLINCLSYNCKIKKICILAVQDDIGWQSLYMGLSHNQSIVELIIGNDDNVEDNIMVSSSFDDDDNDDNDTIMMNSTSSEIDFDDNYDLDDDQQEHSNSYMKLNHIGCYSIQMILSKLYKLKSFQLHGCMIDTDGIQMIANGIEYHALFYDTLNKFEIQQIEIMNNNNHNNNSSLFPVNEGFGPILISLSKLNHIQTLHIIDCNLSSSSSHQNHNDNMILSFEYLFHNTKSLQYVRLIQCQLNNNIVMKSICYGISFNTSILTLDLRNNNMNDCCTYIGHMLYNNHTIQKLILEQNHINNNSLHQLCTIGLQYNKSLQHLNVINNHITDINCLLNIFPNINPNDIIPNNNDKILVPSSSASSSSKLNTLLLSYNNIGNIGAKILGMIIHQFHNLEIEGCSITDDGIYDFCNGLLNSSQKIYQQQEQQQENEFIQHQQYPPPLKRRRKDNVMMSVNDSDNNDDIMIRINTLNMSHNVIGYKGAIGISNILSSHNVTIQSLHLRSCQLNNHCIETITNGIINHRKYNKNNSNYNSNNIIKQYSLKELNISFNHINNDGAKYISDMIQNNQCYIETLNIQYNDFTNIGTNYIVDALRNNYFIKELLLYNSNLCYDHNDWDDKINHWLRLNSSGRCFIPSTTLNHYHYDDQNLHQHDSNNHDDTDRHDTTSIMNSHHDDNNMNHNNRTTGLHSKSYTSSSSSSSIWPQLLLSHANREYGATAVFHLLMEMPHL